MSQPLRNWEPPNRLKVEGKPTCKHANSTAVTWHQTAISPQEGRPVLGYVVVRERRTTICADCPLVKTETLAALQPTEGDLRKHFKNKVSETMLRRLRLLESEQAKEKPAVEPPAPEEPEEAAAPSPEPADDIQEAFSVHGPGEEEVLEEVDLGEETPEPAKEPEVPVNPVQVSEVDRTESRPVTLTSAPKGLASDFWKKLPTMLRIKSGEVPFSDPSSLLTALAKEAHEVTGAHSRDHLKARLVKLSAHITTDIGEIEDFLRVLMNTSTTWSPMTCRLASEWKLVRLPNDESWLPINSPLCHLVFDNWLGIPPGEAYSHDMRQTPKAKLAPHITEIVEAPPTKTTAEILANLKACSQLAQSKEEKIEKAQADMLKGILEMGPVPAPAPAEVPPVIKDQPSVPVEIYPVLGLLPGCEAINGVRDLELQLVNLTSTGLGIKMVLAGNKLVIVLGAGPAAT